MGEQSHKPASASTAAVFLSYASQDAAAAQRICQALRAAGIEVWFDQSELRSGDVWDHKIRREICDCALFIPVISANTASRREGYFRLEWDLADQRSHRMARDQAFIVPICLDATPGAVTDVPESFHRVHWTRLLEGETPPEFVAGIKRLLSPDSPTTASLPAGAATGASLFPATAGRARPLRRVLPVAVSAMVLAALAYLLINKPWTSNRSAPVATSNATSSPGAPPTAFNPPPHSIAVLPFVNMSGDKDQEYFSEGLTEELLNSLSRINELQVAARTSSFSFQGEHPDIATVAHKLNVAAVLEGSVRRSAHTVRITTQLVNGSTGFHVWSQTYDRDLGDVLQLQTEVATAVASALKVTLLGDEAAKIQLGGTRNPAAFDAYLRATKSYWAHYSSIKDTEPAIAGYTEAIRLDPDYALAYSGRSLAIIHAVAGATTMSAIRAGLEKAEADARKAITLAPDMSEGHQALALAYQDLLDFTRASEEYERAVALGPGNARALRNYGIFAAHMGRGELGLTLLRRSLTLDPLSTSAYDHLGYALFLQRRYPEAIAAYKEAEVLDSSGPGGFSADIGLAHYLLGDFQSARSLCEKKPEDDANQFCLAMTYDKLGRHADAETMLAKARASDGDARNFGDAAGAIGYSAVYAQWGNTARALDWLETSMRMRSPDLAELKSPLLDPIRKEPRFQAIQRELKFPD